MLVVVAPGQGAQAPGFLTPWLDVPGFADRLGWLSAAADIDLAAHGTTSDAETIRDTAVAQPLLVASGLVSLLALFPHPADGFRKVAAGAGHSVGEITAAAAAGVINAEQAMVFVRERGRAMAGAAAVTPTGMTAVLGGDADEVTAALARHGLTPANVNAAGQVVAAGTGEQLAALAADPPPGKVRLIPLQVAGAFHTSHMAPAVSTLEGYARAITTHDARVSLLSNKDGQVVHHGPEVLSRIVGQVASPVRWDLCMQTMAEMGVTGLLELPPAGTLAGLAKRALPGVATFALKTPDQLDDARTFIEEHGSASDLDGPPSWRLIVSPAKGAFATKGTAIGDALAPGEIIGTVTSLREATDVPAPHGGTVLEWLVEDGDPVSPGQPLLRLHPTGVGS